TAPAAPTSTIPTKNTFLQQAKDVYGFTPDSSSESQFKKNYTDEAKKAGLTADQIAGVYAFETGGNGKLDDQPIRKDGTAISTALGYAQLLNATSVDVLAKHGEQFATELDAAGKPDKAALVRKMAADAKGGGDTWAAQQAFAKTPQGRAMQAANLDVDIGPKMQIQMLKDIETHAGKLGVTDLTPAKMELMNLAGDENGVAMMQRPELPTANFFDRAGYEANPVARGQTGGGLLQRIDHDMIELGNKQGVLDLRAAYTSN
ncbi:MAG TPA: hypothetical protein VGO62_13500, partial [Myxococcota bacterium]